MRKRGISPVIATMLLVSLVLILASIISFWSRGSLIPETIYYGDRNINLVCEEVKFSATYGTNIITILNNGNIPIEGFEVRRISENGDYDFLEPTGETEVLAGSSGNFEFAENSFVGYDEIFVIPVLLGKSDGVDKIYTCDERHGVEAYEK